MQRVRELLRAFYADTQQPFYTIDMPNWERFCAMSETNSEQFVYLWELAESASQKLVGIAMYHKGRGTITGQALAGYRAVENEMYDWAERQHRENRPEQAKKWPLKCSVCESNTAQQAILTQRGYTKLDAEVVFRKRALDIPIPKVSPPKGYEIQDLQNARDDVLVGRAAIENQVFERNITTAFFHRLLHAPIYRPEWDLVMVAPDGTVAAFCTLWFDTHHRIGFCEPVGTSAAHRQRGLAKALMLDGFERLRALGATTVYLGHSASNVAANRLYDSVGMTIFDQESLWQKEF
ncbi:MAG: GNAT family N-acetyltransferase [Chloroflexi bacterium]|nr:GNAT family N-acetyltransferase [Chloroflexota bacterium]